MTGTRILRSATGLVWLVAVAAVVLFLLGDVVVRGSWLQALLIAPWLLIPVWAVYAFLYAPHIAVDEERIRVHNILRTIDLPWSTVDDVVMRWQLELHLTADAAATGVGGRKGIVEAWSFSRRWRGVGAKRTDDTAVTLDVIRGLHASAGRQPGARPTVTWDLRTIAVGAAIVVACVAAMLIAG
ncbi:hypothetical protein [Microbacterium paludicola]|uniref:hypothetical protein n=1 Tax=Microbacterium paludicola TaxID=300019 RepID=UPI0031D819A3